jgi:hypothetical protein
MATRKYRRKSKPRRKHTRHQRGGDDCNKSLFKINCSLLGISNPDTITVKQVDDAYLNTLEELRNVSASNPKNISSKRRITAAYNNVIICIESRGHVAHPPKSQKPAGLTPRRYTLKANPDGILRSQSERRLPIRTSDSPR